MSEGKEPTFADFAAMFRFGPKKITMTQADAVRLAEAAQVASDELKRLRAERIAEISARFKAEGEFSTMQRRIARQRRALAKMYLFRHDRKLEITRLSAELATARREGIKEAAQSLIEKYQSMVIRPNTPEAWRFSILQDLRAMAGEKPNVITAADIDAAAIRAAAGDTRPSEEIIREDRDAWPDHQANDSIRAALEGGKRNERHRR